jgi:hypothetical protein
MLAQQLFALAARKNDRMDIKQLVTPTEAAILKGLSLNLFKHYLKRPDAPKAVIVGDGHVFYERNEVKAWKLIRKAQKNTRKGVPAGTGPAKQGDQP